MTSCPINWLSKKQVTVALSRAETEYIALDSAQQEAAWLRYLLWDLGENCTDPIPKKKKKKKTWEKTKGAIAMARNPTGHERRKHMDIRYYFVPELTYSKIIEST